MRKGFLFTKVVFDETKKIYQIHLSPDFMMKGETAFPNGFPVFNFYFKKREDAEKLSIHIENFIKQLAKDYVNTFILQQKKEGDI